MMMDVDGAAAHVDLADVLLRAKSCAAQQRQRSGRSEMSQELSAGRSGTSAHAAYGRQDPFSGLTLVTNNDSVRMSPVPRLAPRRSLTA